MGRPDLSLGEDGRAEVAGASIQGNQGNRGRDMRARTTALGVLIAWLVCAAPVLAQAPRLDAIWARKTTATITLDGNLNEAAWASAETKTLKFGYDNGIPGSGYVITSASAAPWDTALATLKFLVKDNQLFMGAVVADKSVGGTGQFNYFDGLLMGLKDHGPLTGFPKPVMEYLYSWWYVRHGDLANPCNNDSAKGNPPIFKGRWAPDPVCDGTGAVATRTAEQQAAWNAVTVVNGISNSDTLMDVGYTVEMKFDLGVMGYDVTQPQGDIVEWNIQVYDADYYWPGGGSAFFQGRNWWQGPWGNLSEQNEVRIFARPDVTTSSGAVPVIPPEFRIPTAGSLAAPTIDGALTDPVWSQAPSFDIRWNDPTLRASYPAVGKYRSGDYQPRLTVNAPAPAPLPDVADGGDATVKYFFKGNLLYFGFDVRDKYVQNQAVPDRWDGFTVSINDRGVRDVFDHNLEGRALSFIVGPAPAGTASPQNYLPSLITAGAAHVAIALKPGTTVDNDGTQFDTGYTAELSVDLTALGYPPGLGDGTLFLGITLHDGDSFSNPLSDSYATRTWWFREREEQCCPVWAYLDPTLVVGTTGVGDGPTAAGFVAHGNAPNPFRLATNLEFTLGRASDVTLEVFSPDGRLVQSQTLGRRQAGRQHIPLILPTGRSGLYLYRLRAHDPLTGEVMANLSGKLMQLR